ncbi:hypothetical protein NLJ89_g4120 [Agrocybe chaxingu]|uniref:2-dehydropantoate 2-reductase n=1 Tax=Agrocybe chaxingu TaxID=84603 RepID=A0A9W8K141_9AGAR|nr:hypothetical protein NLJ89_g4120 [Agrocybe chaxingu]
MHFHILGVGPVGSLFAHHLRRTLPAAHTVSLIHRTRQDRQRLLDSSFVLERGGEVQTTDDFQHEVFEELVSNPPSSSPPIDSVFVALKAQHTYPALSLLAPRLPPHSTVVLLQNGMGIYENLISTIFRNPKQRPHFILASNTHGAFLTEPFHAVHAGVGSIEFAVAPDSQGRDFEAGLDDESTELSQRRLRLSDITFPEDPLSARYRSLRTTVAALLVLEGLNTSWRSYSDIQMIMRRKLVVNAVINPLTALMGCRNGQLFDHPEAKDLLQQVCDEAHSAYAAQMKHDTEAWLEDLESSGVDMTRVEVPTFPETLTSEALQKETVRIAEITKGNISSTLRDVRRGRKTEIDFINGYLVGLGRTYGLDMPVNSALLNLVKLRHRMPLDPIL